MMKNNTTAAVTSRLLVLLAASSLILSSACTAPPEGVVTEPAPVNDSPVFELAAEVERTAVELALWPGFDPLDVPLAVYDGTQTWLFRHPSVPEGFAEVAGTSPAALAYEGRHPEVTANSSALIGDATTATLLFDPWPEDRNLRDLAALTIHESFHVYQRENHKGWIANEAALFTYPFDDINVLTLLRSEILAFRRAFEAEDAGSVACWTLQALKFRNTRFTFFEKFSKDPALAMYERGTELNEGLASYVEHLAGGSHRPDRLFTDFGAEEVRSRAYATGLALALLLDRFSPGWQKELAAGTISDLDTALAAALESDPAAAGCDFTAAVKQQIVDGVFEDVKRLTEDRERLRTAFDEDPGWRLVIEAAENRPLMLAGFDPLNVRLVNGGVLHTRYIKLGNEAGTVELMGGRAFTESAGSHPLFAGVRRMVITGLEAEPAVVEEGPTVRISVPALTAAFDDAAIERSGSTVTVRLPGE